MLGVWHDSFAMWSKLGYLIRPRTLQGQKNQCTKCTKAIILHKGSGKTHSEYLQSTGCNLVTMVDIRAGEKEHTTWYLWSCTTKIFTTCSGDSGQTAEYKPMRYIYASWKWFLWEGVGYLGVVLKKERQEATAVTGPKQWQVILGL